MNPTGRAEDSIHSPLEAHFVVFLASALVIGALLRLPYPADIEYSLIWSAQLLVSALFLYYIHVKGGAPDGDYGISHSATLIE